MVAPVDRIRPGSALAAEPDLAVALAAELSALEAAAATGGKQDRLALENALDTWSLLAVFPWRRLNYRWGRWEATQTAWKALISLEIWESYHWARHDDSFQVFDPHTGQRLGEFLTQARLRRYNGKPYDRPEVIVQPGGAVEFAGHPGSIGVYRLPGGGADTIRLTWHLWLNNVILRKDIAALRSGVVDELPPPYMFIDLDLADRFRVWYVDGPDKPVRKAPNAYDLRIYRPGGLPRFGRQADSPWFGRAGKRQDGEKG